MPQLLLYMQLCHKNNLLRQVSWHNSGHRIFSEFVMKISRNFELMSWRLTCMAISMTCGETYWFAISKCLTRSAAKFWSLFLMSSVVACPFSPALPVLPILCVCDSIFLGTCLWWVADHMWHVIIIFMWKVFWRKNLREYSKKTNLFTRSITHKKVDFSVVAIFQKISGALQQGGRKFPPSSPKNQKNKSHLKIDNILDSFDVKSTWCNVSCH